MAESGQRRLIWRPRPKAVEPAAGGSTDSTAGNGAVPGVVEILSDENTDRRIRIIREEAQADVARRDAEARADVARIKADGKRKSRIIWSITAGAVILLSVPTVSQWVLSHHAMGKWVAGHWLMLTGGALGAVPSLYGLVTGSRKLWAKLFDGDGQIGKGDPPRQLGP